MNCTVCQSESVGQIDAALNRGLSVREVGRMFGFGKNVIFRHSKHVERMEQPTKSFTDQQVRVRAHRERVEELLAAAEAKNDLVSATRLLGILADLDRRLIDVPASRRQPENLRVQIVYARPSDGAMVDARQYLSDATRELGWKVALGVVLESMVQMGTVDSRILSLLENFVASVERELGDAENVAGTDTRDLAR